MLKPTFTVAVTILFVILISTSFQVHAFDAIDEIKACANTADQQSRFECYEALGQRVLNEEIESPKPQTPIATESKESLPDDLGGAVFAPKSGKEKQSNRGRVTYCHKTAGRKWIYVFDNGQVWAQVDSKERRHKDCNFLVTITKDNFGYKMQIDGKKGKIRINRRR